MKPIILIRIKNIIFLIFALIFSFRTSAGLIDFETTASGGNPTDNGIISFNDYFMADGVSVSFGFDTNQDGVLDSYGVFEKTGGGKESGNSGFKSSYGSNYDIAATNSESLLGDFFLRQSNAYMPFGTFHIIYGALNPVTSASGEIWDIDGNNNKTEQFFVEAFNGTDSLASILSPLGNSSGSNSLDGKPWAFGFNDLSNITRIEISFTGSKEKGIGLAFNNFSPIEDISKDVNSVPEPSTVAIFALGIIALVSRKLKKES
jgi:hypothetical protein